MTRLVALLAMVHVSNGWAQSSPVDQITWMGIIGRLEIPTKRWQEGEYLHSRENCTASLLIPENQPLSSHVLSAWHCIEYYKDLSRPIRFHWTSGAGSQISREARPVFDGGGMLSDWAILKLDKPVDTSAIARLPVYPGLATDASQETNFSLAGYADSEGGQAIQLIHHGKCRKLDSYTLDLELDCGMVKGTSGGPAVMKIEENGVKSAYIVGVISRGNQVNRSFVVPSSRFFSAVRAALH